MKCVRALGMMLFGLLTVLAVIGCGGGSGAKVSVKLTASPTTIDLGDSTTLQWTSKGAQYVVYSDFDAASITGTKTVTPTQTTSYTITVGGPDGEASSTVIVKVNEIEYGDVVVDNTAKTITYTPPADNILVDHLYARFTSVNLTPAQIVDNVQFRQISPNVWQLSFASESTDFMVAAHGDFDVTTYVLVNGQTIPLRATHRVTLNVTGAGGEIPPPPPF